ncbi:MAG: metalloprotease PmbA [Gammaproteobacteria bacterium]|nr:metalloprotease PmbA [Gammaproteobacteria bacterium]
MTARTALSLQTGLGTLQEKVADVLKLAKELGATQAEAHANFGTGFSVNVRMREVETLRHQRDQGVSVTVWLGHRKGSASTSDLRPEALGESVRKACALAKYGAEDPASGLADAHRLASSIPDLSLYHPWNIEPAAAIELAMACEAAALDHDPRVTNSEGASVSTSEGLRVYGNSHGFLGGYQESDHSISCSVVAAQDGAMETDYEYAVARDAADLPSAAGIGAEAGRRTVARLGGTKLETRTAPVLFPARVARGLIGHLLSAISGGALYRKSSFLVDALGRPVFASRVTIDEKPHLQKALNSAPFDNEGVATMERRLVDAGVLGGYLLGSYYARKLGMQTTGNAGGAHNVVVHSTGESFDDLLRQMDTGLVLADVMGNGVNPVTGDYSMGASGFWVEKGTIQYPVTEITIAGNLKDMYRQILGIGTDVDRRGGVLTGSILVEEMTIAGS